MFCKSEMSTLRISQSTNYSISLYYRDILYIYRSIEPNETVTYNKACTNNHYCSYQTKFGLVLTYLHYYTMILTQIGEKILKIKRSFINTLISEIHTPNVHTHTCEN